MELPLPKKHQIIADNNNKCLKYKKVGLYQQTDLFYEHKLVEINSDDIANIQS